MITDNTEFTIATAPRRDSKRWAQGRTSWGELVEMVRNPETYKECGNYLLGRLSGARRSNGTLIDRSALTLDVDNANPEFADELELSWEYAALAHTTFNSTPENPRYRLIIPVDRDLRPDEYVSAARFVMKQLGEEKFDPSTTQPARYMFRASYDPKNGDKDSYDHLVLPGDVVPAEVLLKDFQEDLSDLTAPALHKNKRDPLELPGIVGAFNRVYGDLETLVERYDLPYEPSGADRWHLVGARSVAGMSSIGNGLFYSHHSSDPAAGRACSAFDLVRVHLFGEMDEDSSPSTPVNRLPSTKAMTDHAMKDDAAYREMVNKEFGQDFAEDLEEAEAEVMKDFPEERKQSSDWHLGLQLSPRTGKPEDVIDNWDLIAENDPVFRRLVYNELLGTAWVDGGEPLPWREVVGPNRTQAFGDSDFNHLKFYFEISYHIRPNRQYFVDYVTRHAQKTRIHPLRDHLRSLVWDGTPRLETCLPGVQPDEFTRMVARKCMVGAVARMLDPGCKWDHMLVLYGPEGIGKTRWIEKVSMGYDAPLGDIASKDTLMKMLRSWIMVSDEGHMMRKADFDAQKEFLTRTSDMMRAPYGRTVEEHPRQTVIWATTNDEEFLRRGEGNRRFLIVRCEEKVDFSLLTTDYIDQLWAEAVHLYREGESLFLTEEESALAGESREAFTESEDDLVGLIQAYMDTPVPRNWGDLSSSERRTYLRNLREGYTEAPLDSITPEAICGIQVWTEILGEPRGAYPRTDQLRINRVLRSVPGLKKESRLTRRLEEYGPQRYFVRPGAAEDEDLL